MALWPIDKATISKGFAYAWMSVLAMICVLIILGIIQQTWFNDPPIRVHSLDAALGDPLCPGEHYDFHSQVTVTEPTVLFFYLSVMDDGLNHNINNTQVTLLPRPHPHPSTFTQVLPWSVPELPAGKYARVLAIRGPDGDEDPAFVTTPFYIGEDCSQ